MKFSLRLLLFGLMPCIPLIFVLSQLMRDVEVRYPYREAFMLIRVTLLITIGILWGWLIRELIQWDRGVGWLRRACAAWINRRRPNPRLRVRHALGEGGDAAGGVNEVPKA